MCAPHLTRIIGSHAHSGCADRDCARHSYLTGAHAGRTLAALPILLGRDACMGSYLARNPSGAPPTSAACLLSSALQFFSCWAGAISMLLLVAVFSPVLLLVPWGVYTAANQDCPVYQL